MRYNKMKRKIIIMYLIILLAVMSISHFVYAATVDSQMLGISVINQDPDPANSGDVVEVRLGISNNGGEDTNNVNVEFIPSYPFTIVSGDSLTQEIGTIGAYQGSDTTQNIKIIKYRLLVDKDANARDYDLQFKISSDGLVNSITKTVSLSVSGGTNAEIIHIDKTVIVPGQQSSLKFRINNVGNAPLKDLTFSWENSAGVILPVGSDNTRYVKYIDVGGSAELEYQVIADTTVDAGLYQLNLYLTYNNPINNTAKTISTIAGVYVGGGTDFDVAYSDSTSGTTSFTIANIGSNPATSVSVIIPEQRGWRVTGSNSMIIGNLNKGDYTVASFKLQQSSNLGNRTGPRNMNYSNNVTNSASNYPMNNPTDGVMMQIAYTDTMGIRTLVNKTIKIGTQLSSGNQTSTSYGAYGARTATKKTSGFSKYVWYVVLALVLIVGFFIYKRYARQKLLTPNSNIKDVFKTKKR
jgi:hypothetical protein